MKHLFQIIFLFCVIGASSGCGVYSLSGASIDGKTINIHVLENRAQNVVPTLSATLTSKIRSRILSQTGLAPVNAENSDYDLEGQITMYQVSVSGVQQTQQASQNRLTISVNAIFTNRLNEKASFTQTFTRFADFPATQTVQAVEASLIDEIGTQIADDIFNKAFVNW
ncbi:MAG TPA: LptE family protein [Flavipsychrobacter sp.]|nr:LptE family protein [Flavipsychrobacter sp.]